MNVTESVAQSAHPSKVDTLQAEVHKLHSTIDSLHREVHDLGIASTYYHDIINSDVAIFVAIVTIIIAVIGFLSWRIITRAVSKAKREFSAQLETQKGELKKFNTAFDEKMKAIDERDAEHTYNISRAMYFSQVSNSCFENALAWSIQAVLYSFKVRRGDHSNNWIGIVRNQALKQELIKEDLEGSVDRINEDLVELKKLKNDDVDKLIEEIKAKIYKVMYT